MDKTTVWAHLRLEFTAEGSDDKHVVVVPIFKEEDILEAVEKVGRLLVNGFAKEAASRMSFAKANASMNGSLVDKSVARVNDQTAKAAVYQHPQRARAR